MNSQTIRLEKIRIDGGTQPRVAIDEDTVADYADKISGGVDLPPAVVFGDGVDNWLADGFHRFHAFRRLGRDAMPVELHTGTKRDAVLFSVGANTSHGLRRTNEDKRRSVQIMLSDSEWKTWVDSEIARRCGVSHVFVGDVRRGYRVRSTSRGQKSSLETVTSEPRTYTNKHGNTSTMRTENIGRNTGGGRDAMPREPETVALANAHKAISFLQKIPPDDRLRADALSTVARWIKDNR